MVFLLFKSALVHVKLLEECLVYRVRGNSENQSSSQKHFVGRKQM
jgi:hypothetical protein